MFFLHVYFHLTGSPQQKLRTFYLRSNDLSVPASQGARDPVDRAERDGGNGPYYPCPVPGVRYKAPGQEARGHKAPVNLAEGPHLLRAGLRFAAVVALFEKTLEGSPGGAGVDYEHYADRYEGEQRGYREHPRELVVIAS